MLGDTHLICPAGTDPASVGPPEWPARAWWAVWESGSRAVLDGVSALLAGELTGYAEATIHLTCPHRAPGRTLAGVRRHRQRHVERQPGGGLPRTRPETAVIRAAQWASTDRQAALLLAMTVQQRLVPAERVLTVWREVRRSPRRALIDGVIRDVCDGAQALSELDFAAMCRSHRLPEPTRQAVRRGRSGRVYLDVWWQEARLGAEIEGAHHTQGLNAVDDALRQNDLTIDAGAMLRIPVLGLRLNPQQFMDQVARAYRRSLR